MSKRRERNQGHEGAVDNRQPAPDLASLGSLPISSQQIEQFFSQYKIDPFAMRLETVRRIEKATGIPLLCYVTKTSFVPADIANLVAIEDGDVEGFDSLIDTLISSNPTKSVDILFVSNGGSAEIAERIVRMLRENFETVRFILPGNAFSAATMMAFACDSILMTDAASLGPIDPQINGIPARTILRGFEDLEKRLKTEGPEALTAYIHLLNGYSLHLLEFCKSAEELSKELAQNWLSRFMLKCDVKDSRVAEIVDYFGNFDIHKSHARSIGRQKAIDLGLNVVKLERGTELERLVRSLGNQYVVFFNNSAFYKVFENAYGTAYGRRIQQILIPNEQL